MSSLLPWRKRNGKIAVGGARSRLDEFPFAISRLRDEFDRMFDRLAREAPAIWERDGWRWGLEIEDEDNAITVRAEAPGFEAGDFDIQVSDNTLTLRAARKSETKGKEGEVREYRELECYESVLLPQGVDAGKVDAQYHNGVLTVTLPKTTAAKGKRIAVKST